MAFRMCVICGYVGRIHWWFVFSHLLLCNAIFLSDFSWLELISASSQWLLINDEFVPPYFCTISIFLWALFCTFEGLFFSLLSILSVLWKFLSGHQSLQSIPNYFTGSRFVMSLLWHAEKYFVLSGETCSVSWLWLLISSFLLPGNFFEGCCLICTSRCHDSAFLWFQQGISQILWICVGFWLIF